MVAPSSDPTVSRCSSFTFTSLRSPNNPPQGVAKVPVRVILEAGRRRAALVGFLALVGKDPAVEDRRRGPPLLTASRG